MTQVRPFISDQGSYLNDQIMISEERENQAARGLSSAGENESISNSPNPTEYLSAEMRISRDDVFQEVNKSINSYLGTLSNGMDELAKIGHDLRQTMTTALNDGNGMTQQQFKETIDDLICRMQMTLNTKDNDKMYVFSGENSSRAPVGDLLTQLIPAVGTGPTNDYYLHKDNDSYIQHRVSSINKKNISVTAGDQSIQELFYALNLARGVDIKDPDKTKGKEVLQYADLSVRNIPASGKRVNEVMKAILKINDDLKAGQSRDQSIAKEAGFESMETMYMELFKNRTLAKVGREISAMSIKDVMELARAISQ